MKIWHINKANFYSEVKRLYQHVTNPQTCSSVKSVFIKMSHLILYISYTINYPKELTRDETESAHQISHRWCCRRAIKFLLVTIKISLESVWIYTEIHPVFPVLTSKQATLAAQPGSCSCTEAALKAGFNNITPVTLCLAATFKGERGTSFYLFIYLRVKVKFLSQSTQKQWKG